MYQNRGELISKWWRTGKLRRGKRANHEIGKCGGLQAKMVHLEAKWHCLPHIIEITVASFLRMRPVSNISSLGENMALMTPGLWV